MIIKVYQNTEKFVFNSDKVSSTRTVDNGKSAILYIMVDNKENSIDLSMVKEIKYKDNTFSKQWHNLYYEEEIHEIDKALESMIWG